MRPEQEPIVLRSLANAFLTDDLMVMLQPDEAKRSDFSRWFMGRALAYARRWGQVTCSEDAAGAAIWLPPANTNMSVDRLASAGFLALPFKIGLGGTGRFLHAMEEVEKIHKAAVSGPHLYLWAIGSAPGEQGRGIGSALLDAGCAQADAAGNPTYLETMSESNVAFYARRGFVVKGEVELNGFRAWGMVRQPKPVRLQLAPERTLMEAGR
jgi:GNAT superfamily N-acetyltransferase